MKNNFNIIKIIKNYYFNIIIIIIKKKLYEFQKIKKIINYNMIKLFFYFINLFFVF